MKLPVFSRLINKEALISAVAILLTVMVSCDSAIYDDQGDCTVHYRVGFRFTKNILDADAFGSQVTDINLALYDKAGNLVLQRTEHRTPTIENDYFIEVDVLPGTYDIVAWCDGKSIVKDAVSFEISGQSAGDRIEDSAAKLPLQSVEGRLCSNNDINRFYHGIEYDVEFEDSYGIVDIGPVYLTKDTNHLTISLQNMDGTPLDYKLISIELEGRGNELDWTNNPVGNTSFVYKPWISTPFCSTPVPDTKADGNSDEEIVNGILTEITTSRFMAGKEQMLTVRRTDTNEVIFSIPLLKNLLLIRSHYDKAVSNQDYFDRVDDFKLQFFLEGMTWIKTKILINGWRVLPVQSTIL